MYVAKQGDRAELMLITTSADLTGATLDNIFWQRKDEIGPSIEGAGTLQIVSAAPAPVGSVVSYRFSAGETDEIAIFKGDVKVTKGGLPLTVPGLSHFEFRITKPIPAP